MPDGPKDPSPMRLLGAGMELGGVVVVMAGIGYGIDRWLDSGPWGVAVMSLVGVTGGLYNLIKQALRDSR